MTRELPGAEPDREHDAVVIAPEQVFARHHKLTHRADLVLIALQQAGIPMSRFTHEALCMVTEALDFALAPVETGERDVEE